MSSIYEWTDRALALPGAPEIWDWASKGLGLVTVDGDKGLYGIASDGTWWEPTGRPDRPWVLAVDHPATAGCLLALLGDPLTRVFWYGIHVTVRVNIMPPKGERVFIAEHGERGFNQPTLGRAAIAAADALGRWPGGEG